ncbi:MAG: PilW family protein [Aquabacterium sp.]|uniref:PilW family protein n=1 Tax=Aquabacterium sp. TaxID=1872578 RepID=UPI0025C5F78C|nr:PilW family protein [Aquabacterium sp.]MBI5925443.1 PilW family protein [Aquabacterium sp.]
MHPLLNKKSLERGLSLVEILVSMAIGLVVVGAVFANFINSTAGARQSAALAQVTEDATLALGILRNHITMADYSQPTGTDAATGVLVRRLDKQLNLLGCDGGFDTSTDNEPNPTSVTCVATGKSTGSDALLVRYEADSDALPTVTDDKTKVTGPMDCRGFAIPPATGGTHFVADNRFFVNTTGTPPTLSCIGNGGADNATTKFPVAQPLVENISEMLIRYGVASLDPVTKRPLNIVRYATAEQVGKPPESTNPTLRDSWSQVVSVRICVVVRSTENVLDKARPYRNCAGDIVRLDTAAPTDRRIYRAFTSTVVLNNRVNTPASATPTPTPTP